MEKTAEKDKSIQLLFVLLILAAALMFAFSVDSMRPASSTEDRRIKCLVIDPGHGGHDGGAIALNGMKESELNLSIALKLQQLASFCGQETVMTRADDSQRTDYASYSEHEDLVYRTELINGVPNAALISIHQNTFPTSQPRGAQVLYAPGQGSRLFGELTHSNIVTHLQKENRRVAEPAAKNLYITANVRCPAILVECGFLSNSLDLDDLMNERYQTALATVLLSSYLQYRTMQAETDYT